MTTTVNNSNAKIKISTAPTVKLTSGFVPRTNTASRDSLVKNTIDTSADNESTSTSSSSSSIKSGAQGTVRIPSDGSRAIKTSSYVDFSLQLEFDRLNEIERRLNMPHFVRAKSFSRYSFDESFTRAFERGKRIPEEELCLDYVKGVMLRDFISHELKSTSPNVLAITSVVKQTLLAAAIMNERLGISHNDLHASNVLVESTTDELYVYRLADGEEVRVPTYGYRPVIIDFGLSSKSCDEDDSEFMTCIIEFTDIGLFPFEMDASIDYRLLLSGVRYIIRKYGGERSLKELYDACNASLFDNLFYSKKYRRVNSYFNEKTGWFTDEADFTNVMKLVRTACKDIGSICTRGPFNLGRREFSDVISLLASRCKLPLKRFDVDDKTIDQCDYIKFTKCTNREEKQFVIRLRKLILIWIDMFKNRRVRTVVQLEYLKMVLIYPDRFQTRYLRADCNLVEIVNDIVEALTTLLYAYFERIRLDKLVIYYRLQLMNNLKEARSTMSVAKSIVLDSTTQAYDMNRIVTFDFTAKV